MDVFTRMRALMDRWVGRPSIAAALLHPRSPNLLYETPTLAELALWRVPNDAAVDGLFGDAWPRPFLDIYERAVTPLFDCEIDFTVEYTHGGLTQVSRVTATTKWTADPREIRHDPEPAPLRTLIWTWAAERGLRWPPLTSITFIDRMTGEATFERVFFVAMKDRDDVASHAVEMPWTQPPDITPVGGIVRVATRWPALPRQLEDAIFKLGVDDGETENPICGPLSWADYCMHRPRHFRNPRMQAVFDEGYLEAIEADHDIIRRAKRWGASWK